MILKYLVIWFTVLMYSTGEKDFHKTKHQLESVNNDLHIKTFIINSTESLRFAEVNIECSVDNLASEDREFLFKLYIPKSAFISGFVIKIDDTEIKAAVKERGAAASLYDEAKEQNVTAGHVTQQSNIADDKDRDIFQIAVNIAKRTNVVFRLQYQELLERHAGMFTQTFFILPQNQETFVQVTSKYVERQGFKSFNYKSALDHKEPVLKNGTDNGYYTRELIWTPDLGTDDFVSEDNYKFEVTYELEPLENGGQLIYNTAGDFAHYFSSVCDASKIMSKKMVFVIDISGSMSGIPIQQVREAMNIILDQLRFDDYFNLILFQANVQVYKNTFVQATEINIVAAKNYIKQKVIARGGTNMNDALLKAVQLFPREDTNATGDDKSVGHNIVFLTDGEPTAGVTNRNQIRLNVRAENYQGSRPKSSIFTVAFSKTPDIQFLRTLTEDNYGSLRVIRASLGSEIGQELVDLYAEIHNPYYRNVNFEFYTNGKELPEESVTQSYFVQYDCGAELIVGGQVEQGLIVTPRVTADGAKSKVEFANIQALSSSLINSDLLSRLVAYKKVKELLKKAQTSLDKSEISDANKKALEISLEMEFVTPLTSLIVSSVIKSPKPRNSKIAIPRTRNGFNNVAMDVTSTMSTDVFYDDLNESPDNRFASNIYNSAAKGQNGPTFLSQFVFLITVICLCL